MRVLAIIMATGETQPGSALDPVHAADLRRFDEQLVRAGVMLAGGRTTTMDANSAARLPITGFWLWQVRSIDEAIAWAQRSPRPAAGCTEIELHQVHDLHEQETD
jgi:hypothetical protein